jgi:hypothetical protein
VPSWAQWVPSRGSNRTEGGPPPLQNVRLKLDAALDCEADHSVVTGIRHWYQVIRQTAKFFHLLCCFERSSVSPFGRTKHSSNRSKANAEHRAATLRIIVDDLRSQGITSVRAVAAELNERGILTPRGGAWHPTSAGRLLSRLLA